jgi:hypothetical protein
MKIKCAKNGTLINGRKRFSQNKNYNLDSYKPQNEKLM